MHDSSSKKPPDASGLPDPQPCNRGNPPGRFPIAHPLLHLPLRYRQKSRTSARPTPLYHSLKELSECLRAKHSFLPEHSHKLSLSPNTKEAFPLLLPVPREEDSLPDCIRTAGYRQHCCIKSPYHYYSVSSRKCLSRSAGSGSYSFPRGRPSRHFSTLPPSTCPDSSLEKEHPLPDRRHQTPAKRSLPLYTQYTVTKTQVLIGIRMVSWDLSFLLLMYYNEISGCSSSTQSSTVTSITVNLLRPAENVSMQLEPAVHS